MGESEHRAADAKAVMQIIARQFRSVSWSAGKPVDWAGFAADFFPNASLFPAARPAKAQTLEAFIERMQGLAQTKLRSFDETLLGCDIRIFGNVAVALGACEMRENDAEVSRGVEALLLVKDGGRWRIVAQAWDKESEANAIPAHLTASVPPQ